MAKKSREHASRWLIPLSLVFVFVVLLAARQIGDPDIGFHLRGGQWILENGRFHSTDVFTYTVNHNEYIAMYWLYQVILYVLFSVSGYIGLTSLNILFITSVFSLLLYRLRQAGVYTWISTFTLFACAVAIEFRFLYRPEIITWIMLILTLTILDQYFVHRRNYLFWLPVIQLFWVNLHGLFILGWFITATYFVSDWVHRKSFDKKMFKWSLISLGASLINPYLTRGLAFPFYLFTRLRGSNIFKPLITEFQSPWTTKMMGSDSFFLTAPLHWYYLLSILGFLLIVLTYRKRRLHEYLLWGTFFYLSVTAVRNVPLFMLVAVQIAAVSLHEVIQRVKLRSCHIPALNKISCVVPIAFAVLVMLLGLRITTNAYYMDNGRAIKFGIGLDRSAHPLGATKFLNKEKLSARILNDLNSGSWLIWQIPQPVFIDGRLEVMQEAFFREYLSSFTDDGLAKIIRKYHPGLILFEHATALNWRRQLADLPEWRIIFLDEKSAIYARQGYATSTPAIEFVELVAQRGIDTLLSEDETWEILHEETSYKREGFYEGFIDRKTYAEVMPMRIALFAYWSDEFRAAELLLLDMLRKTPYHAYEILFNLGAVYYRTGEYEKALFCYGRVLHLDKSNRYARKYRQEILQLLRERG
ncbi:MAG: tetratricopeptide repeat protein [candidate division WOR-3 bacterium]|nr:MAG: tetratricopeptide repeat protein [candidate division WOR-3 bacterium]